MKKEEKVMPIIEVVNLEKVDVIKTSDPTPDGGDSEAGEEK